MLIQGSPRNGSYCWVILYKYLNPYITSMTILFRPNQVMFNNVDSANVVTNSNDEEIMILLDTTRSVKSLPSSAP